MTPSSLARSAVVIVIMLYQSPPCARERTSPGLSHPILTHRVARALSNELRAEGDVFARFGGEEFAAVLPGASRDVALATAQRLVEAVRAVTVRQAANWDLSISVGTFTWHPGDTAIKSGDALALADRALYAAKRDGKDRAIAHDPTT